MKATRPPVKRRPSQRYRPAAKVTRTGMGFVLGSEAFAGALGFSVLVVQARRLGPDSFGSVEYVAAVLAWLLVLVRGGFDVIVYRESARRPGLIGPMTDLLIGLRCVAAAVAYGSILLLSAFTGGQRGLMLATAGLALFGSAFVTDVGLRATSRLRDLALAQTVRAGGFALAVLLFVQGSGDGLRAAGCLILGEICGAAWPLLRHYREYGWPRPRVRRRASLILARRGLTAGLTRFARVSLYALDAILLGYLAGAEFGPYAAGRRLVFGLVALGLVVPSVLAPAIARSWIEGAVKTRARIGDYLGWIWSVSLPAAVGLGLTANQWMPLLFGAAYSDGGPWLALVVARLPWLLTASFAQAALLACRREDWAFRLALGQLTFAFVLVPVAWVRSGPWGVGCAMTIVEVAGAIAGWGLLGRLGVAPRWGDIVGRAFVGCAGMFVVCRVMDGAPLPVVCLTGAASYGCVWWAYPRLGLPARARRGWNS